MNPFRQLQNAIASLRAERDHVQLLIQQYDQLLNVRLGALLTRLSELQQAANTRRAAQSRRRSEQDALVSWQPPGVTQSTNNQSTNQPITDSLKKLYRRAVSLIHPDLFAGDPEREARATELMAQLNAAYAGEDTEAVRELLTDLEDGLPFLDLPGLEPDPQAMEHILKRLTQRHDALVRELAILRRSGSYRIMSDESVDLAAHFDEIERRCLLQIDRLRNELAL